MNFIFSPLAGERLSVMENPFRGELPRAFGAYGVSLSEIGGYSVSVESVAESECESVANFMDVKCTGIKSAGQNFGSRNKIADRFLVRDFSPRS